MPELDLTVILYTVVNFAIVVVVLRLLLFKPVLRVIDKRKALISSELEAAAGKNEAAEQFLGEAENELRRKQDEASHLIDEARRAGEAKKDELMDEARQQAQVLSARVENEIRLERRHNLRKQQDAIVNLSLTLAGRLIGETLDESRHLSLIDDFFRNLDETESERLTDSQGSLITELLEAPPHLAVCITTAAPLPDERKAGFVTLLRSAYRRKGEISFTVDPDLIGGVLLTTGDLMIDNTVKTRLSGAGRVLNKAALLDGLTETEAVLADAAAMTPSENTGERR